MKNNPAHSRSLRQAEVKAAELILTAYDFRGDQYVHVVTHEGFTADIPFAFVLQWEGWYMIFAEHHDTLVFDKEDVTVIFEYRITKVESKIPDISKFKPDVRGDKYRKRETATKG